jgi:hypothetical protein
LAFWIEAQCSSGVLRLFLLAVEMNEITDLSLGHFTNHFSRVIVQE